MSLVEYELKKHAMISIACFEIEERFALVVQSPRDIIESRRENRICLVVNFK